ncbi:chemotaxis protein CheW [Phaeovulum sp. W22_SRMD_FR3]|uniref:chemotaxis protein CheW n=1 Tax=Phaeovulum sp. W22_SRMD_FR3 TaxID=3240274 RepID=UPI003F9E63D2
MNVVTLRLGGEMMALPAECLREILEPVPVTRVPQAGPFAPGLINVRGAVVPLADLRVALGMQPEAATEDTRMLVLDVPLASGTGTVAILADKVLDVTEMDMSKLDAIPGVGVRWPPEFLLGIGKWHGEFVALPDLEKIFMSGAAQGAAATALEEGN